MLRAASDYRPVSSGRTTGLIPGRLYRACYTKTKIMFTYFTRTQVGIIAAVTALVGIGAYLLWPRTPVAVLPDSPNTTTTTVVTAAPTTTKPRSSQW